MVEEEEEEEEAAQVRREGECLFLRRSDCWRPRRRTLRVKLTSLGREECLVMKVKGELRQWLPMLSIEGVCGGYDKRFLSVFQVFSKTINNQIIGVSLFLWEIAKTCPKNIFYLIEIYYFH